MPNATPSLKSGFSLLQLSIALVVIGFIIGGALIGRDLMNAAAISAQLAQIDKYNAAVVAFQTKYQYLPGDIPNPYASQFGFVARGTFPGEGDGNGILEGGSWGPTTYGFVEGIGENGVFWVDLSTAGLIDGGFSAAQEHNTPGGNVTNLSAWFPKAKIGQGNYVYTFGDGITTLDRTNYFGIAAISKIESGPCDWCLNSLAGLTVAQAYKIDSKIDDGLPLSGSVQAQLLQEWPARPVGGGNGTWNLSYQGAWDNTSATPQTSTTCYDNGNSAGATQQYSVIKNGGNAQNCALSFQFQTQ